MGGTLKQSSTAQPLVFLLVESSDHITGLTGATVTVTLSKNGGAFASPAGSVTEIANGWYKVAANATDNGTLGPLLLHATASGADPCDERYDVVSYDPQAATNLGLSGIGTAQTGDAFARLGAPSGASIAADIQTRSTYAGGAVASVTAAVTVGTNSDKTGYALSAAGLDAIPITDPGGISGQTTFPKILVALYRRFFKQTTLTGSQLKTYADNGSSVNTTQQVSDDNTTQTVGAAS